MPQPTAHSPLQLRLLGGARAEAAGLPLRFPDRKGAALLAVLALDGTSTRSRLAALLWDEQGDSDARRNLRRTLHRLRDAGFEPWLESEGDTLALGANVVVDVVDFQRALHAGELQAALDAHTAPLLEGFEVAGAPAFDEWLAGRRAALAQQWRAAAEAHGAALEARGHVRGALAIATQLLEQDSLHEAHYRRAMVLHAALGEREAALGLYERCRRTLGRELGLRPLADTVTLADGIRAGASLARAAGAAATPSPALPGLHGTPQAALLPALQTLPSRSPLVGREPLLAQLEPILARGGFCLLLGAAGLGKSRVLSALTARPSGAHLHEARIGDRRVPYAALARWLRAGAARGSEGLPNWVRAELARLLPEFGAVPSAAMQSDAQRLRLYEAVREAWAYWFGLGASGPTARPGAGRAAPPAMLFDDWQFVDEASAQWWAWWQGQQTAGDAQVPVLVAERPGEALPETAGALREALAVRTGLRVELPPLAGTAVYELVKQLSGTRDPQRFSRRLALATGGHPFYALETLQHLLLTRVIQVDDQGQWHTPFDEATQDYGELPIAPSVQAAVLQRLHALPEATQRLLEAASLTGDDFSLALASSASALDDWEAVRALESALAARVLIRSEPGGRAYGAHAEPRTGGQSGRFRFEHDLFAQAVAAQLLPERRALMHRALAMHLVREGAASAAPARVAAHFDAAGERAQALAWHQRALAQAERRMVLADMLVHAERVLYLGPDAGQRMSAQLARASAMRMLARPAAADEAMVLAAAALAPLGSEAPIEWRLALTLAQAFHLVRSGQVEAALVAVEPLLQDVALEPEQRASLRARRAGALRALGRGEEARADLLAALAEFGPEPSFARGDLLDDLARTAATLGDYEACRSHALQAVPVMEQAGHPGGLSSALLMQGVAEIMLGHHEAALPALLRSREVAARHGHISAERGAILNLAAAYLARGERRLAMQVVDEGYALSGMFAGPAEQQAFIEARYQCRVDAGELGAALDAHEELVRFSATLADIGRRHSGMAVALDLPLWLGDAALARTAVQQLQADLDAGRDSEMRVQVLAKVAACSLLQGDVGQAAGLLALAEGLEVQRPEDRLYLALAQTELGLARGDIAAAQAACVLQAEGGSAEVRALVLAAALRAFAKSGAAALAPWVARAQQELERGEVPACGALALASALRSCGVSGPRVLAAEPLARALHASLGRHADAQARFAQRFAFWLSHAVAAEG